MTKYMYLLHIWLLCLVHYQKKNDQNHKLYFVQGSWRTSGTKDKLNLVIFKQCQIRIHNDLLVFFCTRKTVLQNNDMKKKLKKAEH